MSEEVKFEFDKPQLTRPRELGARVVALDWVAADTLRLAFEPDDGPLAFEPGQYASFVLDAEPERDLRRELRPYSLWGHPADGGPLSTVARMVEGGRCTGWMRTLRPGDAFRFVGPLGAFFLRRPLHPHLVFVATGTGLVPMRCMLADMARRGELDGRRTTLLFGVRHAADLFGVEELQALEVRHPGFRFVPTLSRPDAAWTGARGRVTEHLARLDLPLDEAQVYLCGNGGMIDEVVAQLEARGLHRRTRRVVLEKYFD